MVRNALDIKKPGPGPRGVGPPPGKRVRKVLCRSYRGVRLGGSGALGPGESTKKRPERRMGEELDLKPFCRSSRAWRCRFSVNYLCGHLIVTSFRAAERNDGWCKTCTDKTSRQLKGVEAGGPLAPRR